jgi:hypothetical protein
VWNSVTEINHKHVYKLYVLFPYFSFTNWNTTWHILHRCLKPHMKLHFVQEYQRLLVFKELFSASAERLEVWRQLPLYFHDWCMFFHSLFIHSLALMYIIITARDLTGLNPLKTEINLSYMCIKQFLPRGKHGLHYKDQPVLLDS